MAEFGTSGTEFYIPNRQELLGDNETFMHAYNCQMKLNQLRFKSREEAYDILGNYTLVLNEVVNENRLGGEISTLRGPQVILPHPYYNDENGAIVFRPGPAKEQEGAPLEASGPFFGFYGYALPDPEERGTFKGILAYQVRVFENFHAPSFRGDLLAYGPIETTEINFFEDSRIKALETYAH